MAANPTAHYVLPELVQGLLGDLKHFWQVWELTSCLPVAVL